MSAPTLSSAPVVTNPESPSQVQMVKAQLGQPLMDRPDDDLADRIARARHAVETRDYTNTNYADLEAAGFGPGRPLIDFIHAPLPWRIDDAAPGCVCDARGVVVVDLATGSDATDRGLARMICDAGNAYSSVESPGVRNSHPHRNAILAKHLRTLVAYANWQMDEGGPYHPTLRSAVQAAEEALPE